MSLFYIRPIDPLGEDPPFFSQDIDIFECEESKSNCDHKHFDTLHDAKRAVVNVLKKTDIKVSSDKVMNYSSEGYFLKISGEYPVFDEIEHFEKFLFNKTGQEETKNMIEIVCLEKGIYLYCAISTTLSGN